MGTKLCDRSKMTQNRSSILLAVAVLMIVVVGSSTETMDKVVNEVSMYKNKNQTQYHANIKMNLIDSELNENGIDIQIVHPTEPKVIETILIDKENVTTPNETVETKFENDVLIDKFSIPVFEQIQEHPNETKVENLNQLVDAVPFETTAAPALDETILTLIPINETKSFTDNTFATDVTTSQIETQTQSFGILKETTRHYNGDLSIYFENEPSRVRQLGSFNKETENENEVIVHSKPDFESDLDLRSKTSESGFAHSYDSSSYSNENKSAEDSSILRNSSNEKMNSEPKTKSTIAFVNGYPTKSAVENLVDEIEAVTESTGELTNSVTVVGNVETHNIMKKPGVDNEPVKQSSIVEQTTDIRLKKPVTELDTIVNMVLNTQKEVMEPSSTIISITQIQSSNNDEFNHNTNKKLDGAPFDVKESNDFAKSNFLENAGTINNIKDTVENSNSVGINLETLSDNRSNKLGINDSAILSELQKSFQPQPENSSSPQNMVQYSGSDVPNAEINDDKTVLIENIEISTHASTAKINKTSLVKNTHQPNKGENGILQERKEHLMVHTNIDISTEKLITDPMKAPLQNNQIKIITNSDSFQTNINVPVIFNDKISSGLNKEPFSEMNPILHSENNLTKDNMGSETLEEVQEDQTSKIFMETDADLLNSTNDWMLNPKHYEQPQVVETSTESSNVYKIHYPTTVLLDNNQLSTTTDYARHVDALQTMRDESSSIMSAKIVYPASVGRSFNEIVAEGLGKPLPTRSVGDEPSSSSYSSEDKTTTVLVLCASAGGIFIAFSFAIYLISFQRQHGTLDIEMQEQQCGKDNLDDDDDSETRVSLLNQIPTVDSDEHSSD